MINGFANITIGTANLELATQEYEQLLGRLPSRCDADSSEFHLSNLALRLVRSGQSGITELGFRAEELERTQVRMGRFGLIADADTEEARVSRKHKLLADRTRVMNLSITHASREVPDQDAEPIRDHTISGLDHIVIQSDNPERTAFLLGCQLGLDLRLDRTNEAWNSRLLFFRCGDAIVEVFHALKAKERSDHDRFFGITWRVGDIQAAHKRLSESGIAVSEIRLGRKPGTAVCTIKSHTSEVPTLLIGAIGTN